MDFLCKSQRIGKSLETFSLRIFFLRFLKSVGWYEFSQKEKKNKLALKYMYYNVHCTFVGIYISDFYKVLSKMFCSVL
jgi:hypothetical protein